MKKYLLISIISTLFIAGCGVNCNTGSCPQTPGKERSLADYWAFYEAKDPCADGRACSNRRKKRLCTPWL